MVQKSSQKNEPPPDHNVCTKQLIFLKGREDKMVYVGDSLDLIDCITFGREEKKMEGGM